MIAIFDKNAGYLQRLSAAESPREALAELDSDVGIDPNGLELAVQTGENIYTISPAGQEAH